MIKARIFVSYAREDLVTANELVSHLQEYGCTVWLDRKELLAGDDFVLSLTKELARCDALVLLLTTHSAASSWCQAEVQRALAHRMVVIVVQREPGIMLPDALERMLRDIQRIQWFSGTPGLGSDVLKARRRRLSRQFRTAGSIAVATIFLAGGGLLLASRINTIDAQRRVETLLKELSASAFVWSGSEVHARIEPVRESASFGPELQAFISDTTKTPVARTNAWQAAAALRQGREREWRMYLPQIEWQGGRLTDTLWANTSYGKGYIRDLVAERVRMAGLVFGPSPTDQNTGMSIIGARIRDADIWFLRLDGTQLIDVEFVNSKLRGAQLDLSNAWGIRFLSRSTSNVFLSTDIAIIEDSWIIHHQPPADLGVLDLTQPEQELLFDGVQFVRVRFEGNFKAIWFKNSRFQNCVFASELSENALQRQGNQIEKSIFLGK